MLTYCLRCKKNTKSINSRALNIKNRIMLLSKCAVWGSKKSKFIKYQEAKRLLISLGIKTLLNKIPLLGDIVF